MCVYNDKYLEIEGITKIDKCLKYNSNNECSLC